MEKPCPKCQTPHSKPGIYCSYKCSNAREWPPEKRERLRTKALARNAGWTEEEFRIRFMTPSRLAALKRAGKRAHENAIAKAALLPIEKLTPKARRARVIREQNGCCKQCGLDEWLGQPLTLELEHKDGNRDNNLRENLECLCPNCHSLTKTWRGRKNHGRTGMTKPIPVEGFLSIAAYLRSKGLAPKGKHFALIRKRLESGELRS